MGPLMNNQCWLFFREPQSLGGRKAIPGGYPLPSQVECKGVGGSIPRGSAVPLQDEQPALADLLGPSRVKQPVLAVSLRAGRPAGGAIPPREEQPALVVLQRPRGC